MKRGLLPKLGAVLWSLGVDHNVSEMKVYALLIMMFKRCSWMQPVEGILLALTMRKKTRVQGEVEMGQPGCGSMLPICILILETMSASIIIYGMLFMLLK